MFDDQAKRREATRTPLEVQKLVDIMKRHGLTIKRTDDGGESGYGDMFTAAREIDTYLAAERERARKEQIMLDFNAYSIATDVDESRLIAIRDSLLAELERRKENNENI